MSPERMDVYSLPLNVQEMLLSELDNKESIRWVGQPSPTRMSIKALPMTLFGLVFGGFAIFWMAGASGMFAGGDTPQPTGETGWFSGLFPLFGLPFVLIGLGMCLAPLWARIAANKTAYVITDRRAILMEGLFSTTVRSIKRDDLSQMRRVEYGNGSGDIIFFRELRGYSGEEQRPRYKTVGFMGIDNVKDVEDMLEQLPGSDLY